MTAPRPKLAVSPPHPRLRHFDEPLAACLAGLGIAQPMALGIDAMLADGRLVELFPDWAEECFPLHAYYPSRHLCPSRVRAFVDFVAGLELT